MMGAEKTEKQIIYEEKAAEAAQMERTGNYQKAMHLWDAVYKLAPTPKQKKWCETRANYCARWQGKREKRDD